MQRPASITTFERLYLGSTAIYIVNALAFWSRTRDMMSPSGSPAAGLATPIMAATLAITAGVSILLWWLVARQASAAGKWAVVVTEAIGAIFAVFALVSLIGGAAPNAPGAAIGLVSTALGIAAAAMLFRPDARAWLGEGAPDEPLA